MDEAALHEALDYDDLWSSATTTKLFETIFGEPIFVFKQTQLRVMVPAAERYQTPPHQDAAYIGPTHEFRTCWVPLRDAPKDLGGVTLARRSHTKGVRPHELQDFYESFTQGLKTAGVHLEPEEDHWVSADYRLGDVVVFSPYMVHRSAPNLTSDGVRVSMDTRVQPARSERGYVSLHTAMEIRDEVRAKNDWYPETSVKD
jgi:1-deoxypentalenic acid 11beta-hydroxylase